VGAVKGLEEHCLVLLLLHLSIPPGMSWSAIAQHGLCCVLPCMQSACELEAAEGPQLLCCLSHSRAQHQPAGTYACQLGTA